MSPSMPNHFFMFTLELHFRREEGVRKRTLNVISECSMPLITQRVLREAQIAACQRLETENQVTENNVLDVAILNITYLGNMTQDDFLDPDDPRNEAPASEASASETEAAH